MYFLGIRGNCYISDIQNQKYPVRQIDKFKIFILIFLLIFSPFLNVPNVVY